MIWGSLGRAVGSIFRDFSKLKKGANSERIFGRLLGSVRGKRGARNRLTPRVVRQGKADKDLARPGPKGGRIVYASRIPPTPLIDFKG